MLTDAEILQFIQDDAISEKKRLAKIGQAYYEGNHDIKNYKLYYYDANGKLIGLKGKRIFTIDEATALVQNNKNTFTLKYR